MRPLGTFGLTDGDERLFQQLLQVRLPDVDDVVNVGGPSKQRVIVAAARGARRPQRSMWSVREHAVMEVPPEQTELPELVGNVLPDVCDDAVGTDDDFFALLVLVRRLLARRSFSGGGRVGLSQLVTGDQLVTCHL